MHASRTSSTELPAIGAHQIRIDVAMPVPELGGRVNAVTLADVLQLLHRMRANASVFVSGEPDVCGCIHVRSGEVVDVDAGVEDALAGFFLLISMSSGYVATAEPTKCDRRIDMPLAQLLLLAGD